MVQLQNSGGEECANKFQLQGMNGWMNATRKEGNEGQFDTLDFTPSYLWTVVVHVACSVIIFTHHTPQWI